MEENKLQSSVKHAVQLILQQIVESNKHLDAIKNNKELEDSDRQAMNNFAGFHLMIMSILMHDLKDLALEHFPDAQKVVEWSESNYKHCLDNKMFNPCKCVDCDLN